MMNQLSLSIILPCYNVEKYIAECLDSLYAQDIPETEYEVICVNDCSPDGTRDIIITYQKNHPNLILIDHEVNKKQGGARNTGLRAAQGEYIWFVDPDDFIKPNVFARLFDICMQNKLDVLIFNFIKVSSDKYFLFKSEFVSDSKILSGISFIYNEWGDSFLNHYDGSVCNRIYRKSFLNQNFIVFPENMSWEDVEHSLRTLLFSERIMSISDSFYYYRTNQDSVMNKMLIYIDMKVHFDASILLGKLILDLSDDTEKIDIKTSQKLREGGIWRINRFTKSLLKATIKEKSQFYALIKKNDSIMTELYPYFNKTNQVIIRYSTISKFTLYFFNPIFQLIRKINNAY